MSDQDTIREMRKASSYLSGILDDAATQLIAEKDSVHGPLRKRILHLARFLQGDELLAFEDE